MKASTKMYSTLQNQEKLKNWCKIGNILLYMLFMMLCYY